MEFKQTEKPGFLGVIPFCSGGQLLFTPFSDVPHTIDADFGLRQGSKRSNHAAGFVLAAEWETQKKIMEKGSHTTVNLKNFDAT